MSIPKEPRQLMINLMYLVLTALLALNVSAEVMNAFFSLDKGMATSRGIIQKNNEALIKGIDKQVEAYPKPENKDWQARAKEAVTVAENFSEYIEKIRKDLFEKAGGDNPKIPGQPKDIRNKDITTKMFINDGLGAEIEAKIRETRAKFTELVKDDKETVDQLPLDVEPIPAGVESKNWAEYKFKQMPVAAIFPLLGKIQSDAKNSATAVLNKCAKEIGGVDIKFDQFEPVVSAQKGYIISGEKYEADVFLSARSSTADNISISVNGTGIPVQEGKAHYVTTTSGVGTRKYNVNITVRNPLDNTSKSYPKEFEYEVGQRSVAVSLDKMNVFYIGVDNPISVSAAGVSSNEVKVSGSGVNVASNGGGKFTVTATTPSNDATLTVSGGGVSQTLHYRVKRIPDPVPKLGMKYLSSSMGNGEFKAQGGIVAVLENFDFEARCDVVGFETTYLAKRQDPSPPTPNGGARFNGNTADYVSRAKPGDAYFFDDIKVKCPGDSQPRNLGGLTFRIK